MRSSTDLPVDKIQLYSSNPSERQQYQTHQLSHFFINEFKRITKNYVLFHSIFFIIGLISFIAIGFSFSIISKSSILAFLISGACLTIFTYLILFFYFQTKKTEQFFQLKDEYVQAISKGAPYQKESKEFYYYISTAIDHLVSQLNLSVDFPHIIKNSEVFSRLFTKFHIWSRWKDWLKIKEVLLHTLINHQIQAIKLEPLHLDMHAALVRYYQLLAEAYKEVQNLPIDLKANKVLFSQLKTKCKGALHKAIEELHILENFSPNDPWVFSQFATIYHELLMPTQEILQYEKMLAISPQDEEVLLRLGSLYFQNAEPAKGLKIYQTLLKTSPSKAEKLILFYESHFDYQES